MRRALCAAVGMVALTLMVTCVAGPGKRMNLELEIQSIHLAVGGKISRDIANVLRLGLALGDISDFTKIVTPLMAVVPDLAYVMVSSDKGEILFRAGDTVGGEVVEGDLLGDDEGRSSAVHKTIAWEGREYFHAAVPILDNRGTYSGSVLLGMPAKSTARTETGDLAGAVKLRGLLAGRIMANDIMKIFDFGLDLTDAEELKNICARKVKEDPALVYLIVIDRRGMIFAHSDRSREGRRVGNDLFDGNTGRREPVQTHLTVDGKQVLHSVLPLHTKKGDYQGSILVGYKPGGAGGDVE